MNNYSPGLCGGDFTEANGHLSSPSYPKQYPHNEDCVYTISQPNGTYLLLTFLEFHLFEEDCGSWYGYDYLEIRDGSSEESPLIGKFCGDKFPTFIQSTQSKIWLR